MAGYDFTVVSEFRPLCLNGIQLFSSQQMALSKEPE